MDTMNCKTLQVIDGSTIRITPTKHESPPINIKNHITVYSEMGKKLKKEKKPQGLFQ